MGYRILADQNVKQATINYLRNPDHDVEWIGDVEKLGLGADDESIAAYGRETTRLILTQDDDFLTQMDVEDTVGILFRRSDAFGPRDRERRTRTLRVRRSIRRDARMCESQLAVRFTRANGHEREAKEGVKHPTQALDRVLTSERRSRSRSKRSMCRPKH